MTSLFHALESGFKDIFNEIKTEFYPASMLSLTRQDIMRQLSTFIYIPYLPAFTRPGWLKSYVLGPHTPELLESFLADLWAGVVVALTLLPQVCKALRHKTLKL